MGIGEINHITVRVRVNLLIKCYNKFKIIWFRKGKIYILELYFVTSVLLQLMIMGLEIYFFTFVLLIEIFNDW